MHILIIKLVYSYYTRFPIENTHQNTNKHVNRYWYDCVWVRALNVCKLRKYSIHFGNTFQCVCVYIILYAYKMRTNASMAEGIMRMYIKWFLFLIFFFFIASILKSRFMLLFASFSVNELSILRNKDILIRTHILVFFFFYLLKMQIRCEHTQHLWQMVCPKGEWDTCVYNEWNQFFFLFSLSYYIFLFRMREITVCKWLILVFAKK